MNSKKKTLKFTLNMILDFRRKKKLKRISIYSHLNNKIYIIYVEEIVYKTEGEKMMSLVNEVPFSTSWSRNIYCEINLESFHAGNNWMENRQAPLIHIYMYIYIHSLGEEKKREIRCLLNLKTWPACLWLQDLSNDHMTTSYDIIFIFFKNIYT